MRCEGWRRYGGAFTLGPVKWVRCEEDAIVVLEVQQGEVQKIPSCVKCWNEAKENGIKILSADIIAPNAKLAGELEEEKNKLKNIGTVDIQTTTTTSLSQAGAFLLNNAGFELEALCSLFDEIAGLHAKLDRYTRIAESGKSYGDDLDNIERIAELEAKLDEALTALAPFAHPDLCEQLGGNVEGDESIIFKRNKAPITLGDCRKAAAIRALKE